MLAQLVPSHGPVTSSVPVTVNVGRRAGEAAASERGDRDGQDSSVRMGAIASVFASVALALAQDDGLLLDLVAHRDDALRDPRQRAGAAVLDEPLGAADGRGAVLAAWCGTCPCRRPTACASSASWRRPRGPAWARASGSLSVELRDRAGLGDLEDAVVELRRLGHAARLRHRREHRRRPCGVDRRAERDRPVEASSSSNFELPGAWHEDRAADLADDDGLVEDRRRGGRRRGRGRRGRRWASASASPAAAAGCDVLVGARVAQRALRASDAALVGAGAGAGEVARRAVGRDRQRRRRPAVAHQRRRESGRRGRLDRPVAGEVAVGAGLEVAADVDRQVAAAVGRDEPAQPASDARGCRPRSSPRCRRACWR